ncbi:MAG: hypothetical protein FD136_173 [Chitinophagaceae bacterium]|nr:MAG: hypothetical protein FD136_173 [Chitinophagaceae bacterium]
MPIPEIVKSFKLARKALIEIESLKNNNQECFKDRYVIDDFSFWDLALPTLNLHVIPAIKSNNYKYKIGYLILNIIKTKTSTLLERIKIYKKSQYNSSGKIDILYLGFSSYINKDIFKPFISETRNQFNHSLLVTDSEIKSDVPVKHVNILSYLKNWEKVPSVHSHNLFSYRLKCSTLKNVSFFELIKINIWMKYIFIPKYYNYVVASKYFLSINSPKSIIESDVADPRSRAIIILAKSKKLTTYTFQFAFYNRDAFEWYYNITDKVFVWGIWFKELFNKEFNVANDRMIIMGSPRFDEVFEYKSQIVNYSNILSNKKALIISSYEISSYTSISNSVGGTFKDHIIKTIEILQKEGFIVYIKIHPLETNVKYLDEFVEKGLVVIEFEKLNKIILDVDFVITHGSTLSFNALVLNKTLLFPTNPDIVWWDDLFHSNNLGIGYNNYEEFQDLVRTPQLLKSRKFVETKKYISTDAMKTSSKLISDFILNDKNN